MGRRILFLILLLTKSVWCESKPISMFQAGTTYATLGAGVGFAAAVGVALGDMYFHNRTVFNYNYFFIVPLVGIPTMIYGISAGNARNEDGEFVTFNRQFTQVVYWSAFAFLPVSIIFGSEKSKKKDAPKIILQQSGDGLKLARVLKF